MSVVVPLTRSGRQSPTRFRLPGDRRNLSRSGTRALEVMELFGELRRPLRAIEVARQLDLSPSTTNQLLKTLVDSAHLYFESRSMTYQPSSRLLSFCNWMIDGHGADRRMQAVMRDLQAQTGMIVALMAPNDLFMQIVEVATPEGVNVERGPRVAIFGSATGSAYLSMLDDVEIARLAERARVPAEQIADICAVAAAIRSEGVAAGRMIIEAPSLNPDFWSFAAPLPRECGPLPVVLGMSGPRPRSKAKMAMMKNKLRDAVAALSRMHG